LAKRLVEQRQARYIGNRWLQGYWGTARKARVLEVPARPVGVAVDMDPVMLQMAEVEAKEDVVLLTARDAGRLGYRLRLERPEDGVRKLAQESSQNPYGPKRERTSLVEVSPAKVVGRDASGGMPINDTRGSRYWTSEKTQSQLREEEHRLLEEEERLQERKRLLEEEERLQEKKRLLEEKKRLLEEERLRQKERLREGEVQEEGQWTGKFKCGYCRMKGLEEERNHHSYDRCRRRRGGNPAPRPEPSTTLTTTTTTTPTAQMTSTTTTPKDVEQPDDALKVKKFGGDRSAGGCRGGGEGGEVVPIDAGQVPDDAETERLRNLCKEGTLLVTEALKQLWKSTGPAVSEGGL
jgi:hypothetical protein